MTKFLTAVVAVLGVALMSALAGCGGGSKSSAPPTKTAYLKEVNQICSEGQDRHDQLVTASLKGFEAKGNDPKLQEKLVLELQGPYKETTERLADLPAPAGVQGIEALIAAREHAAEEVDDNPLIVYEGHPYRQVEKLARSSGAGECII